jgi:hypothetical protein
MNLYSSMLLHYRSESIVNSMWIHNRKLAAFHGANNFGEMYLISMRLRPTEVFRIHVVISCIAHTKTAKLFILCVSNKVKGEKTILDQHLCQVYMHKHLYIASVPSTLCALNCSWRGKIIGMKLMLENGCSCSYHVTKNFITPNITSKFSWDSTIKRCCKKKVCHQRKAQEAPKDSAIN